MKTRVYTEAIYRLLSISILFPNHDMSVPKFFVPNSCPHGESMRSFSAHLELASNALRNDRLVSVTVRSLRKDVRSVERSSSPASPSKVDIRVLIEVSQRLADILLTASSVSTTSLRKESLTLVGAEVTGEGLESRRDLVADTSGAGAGPVRVHVLVDIVDELGDGAVRVLDGGEGRGGVCLETGSGSVACTGQEDQLASGTSGTDGGDGGLDGDGPGGHGEVVGFVHDAEDDLGVGRIFCSQLAPQICELGVGRTALANNTTVPAG